MNTLEINRYATSPTPTYTDNAELSTQLSTQAAVLRDQLMNSDAARLQLSWLGRAFSTRTPFGLVDIRQVAPSVQLLDAPRWSAPRGRFWVRPELAIRLQRAAHQLPREYSLGFWEGYRPPAVQRALWETGLVLLRENYPFLPGAELETALETFIARPTPTAPHALGSAVDVALLDAAGRVLDAPDELAVLFSSLRYAGLSNYEPEWWHWSYEIEEWEYLQ